jgi:pyridoxamine 5'-phosphate oxidase
MTKSVIPPSPSRQDYTASPDYLAQAEANSVPIFERRDPFALCTDWMAEARDGEPSDSNAMSLATVDASGMPDVRIVLLKSFDERGFVFYSNSESMKGTQLQASPCAAICLHWKSLRRQIRARGSVERVSVDEADAYFASRARESQIGAWASEQSRPLESRESLQSRIDMMRDRFDGEDVPRPPHWFGWRIVPDYLEFWRDRPFRLHDRLVFTRSSTGWETSRLYP